MANNNKNSAEHLSWAMRWTRFIELLVSPGTPTLLPLSPTGTTACHPRIKKSTEHNWSLAWTQSFSPAAELTRQTYPQVLWVKRKTTMKFSATERHLKLSLATFKFYVSSQEGGITIISTVTPVQWDLKSCSSKLLANLKHTVGPASQ